MSRSLLVLIALVGCVHGAATNSAADRCAPADPSNASAVDSAYCLILGRTPTKDEHDSWAAELDGFETSRTMLLVSLYQTPDGLKAWQGLSDASFIARLHRTLLGRDPDAATRTEWTKLLQQGRPRRSIVRMLVTSTAFLRARSVFEIHPTDNYECPQLASYVNSGTSASKALQGCVDRAPPGAEILLRRGVYTLDESLRITHPLILRTADMDWHAPRCEVEHSLCAELRASEHHVGGALVLLPEPTKGVVIDHIVMNGNRDERQGSRENCLKTPSVFGPVFAAHANHNLIVTSSVFKNALCSVGLGATGRDSQLLHNTVIGNGKHTDGLFSDGILILQRGSWIADNDVVDNTDVDFVSFGCIDCDIQDNRISHVAADWHDRSSFAAMMLHASPDVSGDYTGTDVSGNTIDCGRGYACGYGLLLGADAWYHANLYGGSFHDNVIRNAIQGVLVNHATGRINVWDNVVESSGGRPNASCQLRENQHVKTTAFAMSPQSKGFVNTSRDSKHTQYEALDFTGCLLNSWRESSCEALDGVSSNRPCTGAEAGIAFDTPYCCHR